MPATAEAVQAVETAATADATAPASPAEAAQTASGFPVTVKDGAGREMTFEKPPERVVALYNDSFGLLATIGVKPVAVLANDEMLSDPIYFDGTGKDLPQIRYGDSVNLEDIAAARPDLIFAYSEDEAKSMAGIAPVFVNYGANSLEEVITATRAYGQIFGKQDEAEATIKSFNDRLSAYVARAPRDISVMKLGASGTNKFDIVTVNDPICQILNQVARCDYKDPKGETAYWSYEASIETVLAANPDVILLNNWWGEGTLSDAELLKKMEELPLWGEINAVKNNRVLMPMEGYSNPIASSLPAAQKFLDVYMPALYPQVFPQALTDEQVKEILSQ
jgi:iron complex transport system substrate-binding protein